MAVKSKIVPLQDSTLFVNIMVYGDSGIGKTVFAGSDDEVLFIAPEDAGTLSAKRFGSKAHRWPVESWNDLLEAYEYVYEQIEAGDFPYKWIAIDSLTEMQSMAMTHVLKMGVNDKPGKDPDVPEIQDWQRYYIIFEKMIRAFNDLNVNTLYTALARKVENAEGEDFYVPDIQGKEYLLSLKVASLMTSYGHMKIVLVPEKDEKNEETGRKVRVRRIVWEDTGASRGKDRTRTLAPRTDNLKLKQIREKIENYVPAVAKKAAAKKAVPAKKAAPAKAVAPQEKLENPIKNEEAADISDQVPHVEKAVSAKDLDTPAKVDESDPVATDIAGNPTGEDSQ